MQVFFASRYQEVSEAIIGHSISYFTLICMSAYDFNDFFFHWKNIDEKKNKQKMFIDHQSSVGHDRHYCLNRSRPMPTEWNVDRHYKMHLKHEV